MSFIPVMKAVFSASLLQSSVSHDPSEITLIWWSDAQETWLSISKTVLLIHIIIRKMFWIKRTVFIWKRSYL